MIKQIAGAFVQWLILLMLLLSVMFFRNSILAGGLTAVLILVPLVTFLLNLPAKKHIRAVVQTQTSISKRKQVSGVVTLKNTRLLPIMKVCCRIHVENKLTGQKEQLTIPLSAAPKGETKAEFTICSEYCGYLELSVHDIWLMDWFGFLPLKVQQDAKTHIAVLPDTFVSNVFLRMTMAEKEDSQNWSPIKRGSDQSELFALRDYTPGDSLKQVHWKMSAKKGQMIVKEPSLPTEKSLLLYWDKNTKEAMPEEMDAMAECVASVGQAIINQGTPFVLGWTEGKNRIFETIETDELFLQTIPRMLKYGADLTYSNDRIESNSEYSKVIYFAGTVPQNIDKFYGADMTMLLCDKNVNGTMENVITFSAEHYMEELESIEI